jgi:hypothetical protein
LSGLGALTAVPINFKTDNGATVAKTLNLSTFTATAITVANLVTAITTAAPANWTASVDSVTGGLKLALTTPGTAKYIQVWSDMCDLIGIRAKIIPMTTQKSIAIEPTNVDDERIETVDARGKKTAVISDGYRTGATITVTDSAYDQTLKAFIEGGTLATVAGYAAKQYKAPGSNSPKPIVTIEAYSRQYARDDSQESSIVSYIQRTFKACKGTVGGVAGDRNFQDGVYTLSSTPYLDPITNIKEATDMSEQIMTPTEYNALALSQVIPV